MCVCRSKCVRVTEWLVYVMLCVCTCVRACLRACVRVFKITYFVFNTNLWNILWRILWRISTRNMILRRSEIITFGFGRSVILCCCFIPALGLCLVRHCNCYCRYWLSFACIYLCVIYIFTGPIFNKMIGAISNQSRIYMTVFDFDDIYCVGLRSWVYASHHILCQSDLLGQR